MYIFGAVAQAAAEEEETRVAVVTNRAPAISGSAEEIQTVFTNESATFSIVVFDANLDWILMSLDLNEGDAFQLNILYPGQAELIFNGLS